MFYLHLDIRRYIRFKRLERVDPAYLISALFLITCIILDFTATAIGSGGDWTMEGNVIAQWIWRIFGPFRFIELPIWILVATLMTYLVYSWNKFIGLLWINIIAFNHLFGFVTWLPYDINLFVTLVQNYRANYPIGLMSIVSSIPISILQSLAFKRRQVVT